MSASGCCPNATVITLSGIGPTTLCNLAIDTWVDVAYDFITGSVAIPASASPISMPAAPITVSDADAVFSSLASAMSSYLASVQASNNTANATAALSNKKTASATMAASTPQATPTAWVMTTVSGWGFCSSGFDIAGLTSTTIDGTTSSWCETGGVVPTGPATSSVASAVPQPAPVSPTSTPTTAPSPTPSVGAFEAWREDSCDDNGCTSTIYGWQIALSPADQTVDPCTNSKYTYNYDFAQSMANDNSNYTVVMKKINTLGYKGLEYLGSNDGYEEGGSTITGSLFSSDGDASVKDITCNPVPGAVAKSCTSSHNIAMDNWTPVAYCLR